MLEDGKITTEFYHFDAGTPLTTIYLWIEITYDINLELDILADTDAKRIDYLRPSRNHYGVMSKFLLLLLECGKLSIDLNRLRDALDYCYGTSKEVGDIIFGTSDSLSPNIQQCLEDLAVFDDNYKLYKKLLAYFDNRTENV